jgi:outer membrane protein TolC
VPVSAHAGVLSLANAERKAVEKAFEVQSQELEERAREWEKKNKVAGYLPTVSYTGTYMMMDDRTVNRANQFFESIEDPSQNPFTLIGRNAYLIDSIIQVNDGGALPDPDLYMGGGMEDFENPQPMFRNSFSHAISVTQPITNGGVELIAITIAKHTKKAVELQLEATRQEALYSARNAYFDALQAAEAVTISRKSLAFAERNLKKAKARHESGAVPVTDVLRWEAEVIRNQNALAQAEAGNRVAVLLLYQAMGTRISEADGGVKLDPVEAYEQWYAKGPAQTAESVETNPQLRAIKSYTKAARGYEQVSKSQYFPKLNAFYTYSWPAWNKLQPWQERRGWTAGAVLSVPIFTGFRNTTSYRMSRFEYKKTVVEERKVENQLRINLERIAQFYKAAYESVEGAKKQRELMDRHLAAMQQRYDGGLVNQTQLLEVALGVDQARLGYIEKLFNCLLLESEYLKAVGKLSVRN